MGRNAAFHPPTKEMRFISIMQKVHCYADAAMMRTLGGKQTIKQGEQMRENNLKTEGPA